MIIKSHASARVLSGIVFIIFSFFLYYAIPTIDGHRDIDSTEYEIIGKEYATTGNLYHPEYPAEMPSHTIAYHWFVGIIFSLFNFQPPYIFLTQIFLSILCSVMLYLIALQIFSETTALITLLLFSCNLGFLVYSQLILAEIVLVTFLIVFIQYKKPYFLVLAGFLLGCSIIVKPVALFYALPLSFLIFLMIPTPIKKKLSFCALFLSCFYIPVIGYMFYNKRIFDTFAVTNLVHENLFTYFLPRRIIPRLTPIEQEIFLKQIENTSEEERPTLRKKIFFDIIQRHPFILCSAWLNAMTRTFLGLYSTQLKSMFNPTIRGGSCSFFKMNGSYRERLQHYITFGSISPLLTIITFLEACWLLLHYFLAVIAVGFLVRNKEYFLLLFFSSYIGYFAFVTGHDGCGRYRLMFEPILLLLAACALATLYRNIKTKNYYSLQRQFINVPHN